MLELARLGVDRQLNVGNAIVVALEAQRPTPLAQTTRARGEALLAATRNLSAFNGPSPAQVDRATDTVITAFARAREEDERALLDTVIPLGPAQRESLARLRLIRARLFPQGTAFIRRPMDLEWRDLRDVRVALKDPEVAAAIDAEGLRAAADHIVAHIGLYGRTLGVEAGPAGSAEERASAAWHEAFKFFAAQVMIDYEKDTAIRAELLSPYEIQLEEQRAEARAAARARKLDPTDPSTGSTPV